MNANVHPLDQAFETHLGVSAVLRDDLAAMLKAENQSPTARRNLVRATGAMADGLAFTLCEVSRTLIPHVRIELTPLQERLLTNERRVETVARIRETFELVFRIFELPTPPQFRGTEWEGLERTTTVRHRVMHPKTVSDLEVDDAALEDCNQAIRWLLIWGTEFLTQSQQKYLRD